MSCDMSEIGKLVLQVFESLRHELRHEFSREYLIKTYIYTLSPYWCRHVALCLSPPHFGVCLGVVSGCLRELLRHASRVLVVWSYPQGVAHG